MLENYKNDIIDSKKKLKSIIYVDDEEINSIIQKYFSTEGKGVRMQLELICSRLGDYKQNREDIINMASLVELIHTTTLIHDDIIDGAIERRSNLTLNNLYNNRKALYIGDFLFARVLTEVSKIKDFRIHKYLTKVLKELCLGEIIQYNDLFNIDTRPIDYLKKIKRKTAILIAFACVSGAIVSNANDADIQNSYKFGYYLGMSYQIMDDYLDFLSDSKILGKDIAQDFNNGNITLPIILKIKKDRQLFNNFQNLTNSEKEYLISEIKNDKDVMDSVKNLSYKYLNKAKDIVEDMDKDVKEDLLFIADILSKRIY
ncbi:polyprenyl synthetase family protein [Gemella sp. GH3]|uniref:polyprenyl synthetase family protein n=1 Tax=unclassified Gemella TaxID=2624949 RepID=UPI0015CFF22D|nr:MULTISPECIES: polyprenyl synthetase family protein [unclassified Gemella]MBF0714013.1 polyprenyl synthetase family protein [Gemella sp. GH3.1]NYS50965.1 polyprenyl synthetase family protein [Gemella sp. GH3]